MPADPDYYLKSGVKSTWPACIAFKAAQFQGEDAAERFLRRLMEVISLEARDVSTEEALADVGRQAGLDHARLTHDIRSTKAQTLFQRDKGEMDVNFLTLKYVNRRTGKGLAVGNVFESRGHEDALEPVEAGPGRHFGVLRAA
jgi:hypothetical protein